MNHLPLLPPQPLRPTPCGQPTRSQRGVALFVVMIFVMLSMLLALWASRTSLFNEMVVGNDADYQRAFEAAQALLQDAELDIRSAEPGKNNKTHDGVDCSGGGDICRLTGEAQKYQIPNEDQDVGRLLSELASKGADNYCQKALCLRRTDKHDFWNDAATLAKMTKNTVGARYGQFTGAAVGSATNPGNPILADRSAANAGGWYWIEVMPYIEATAAAGSGNLIVDATSTQSSTAPRLLKLTTKPNVVYRITALAYGRKPGSTVVLEQTYAQQRRTD